MSPPTPVARRLVWPVAATIVIGATFVLWWYSHAPRRPNVVSAATNQDVPKQPADEGDDPSEASETPEVKVVLARAGAMVRITNQAGSVETDEVQLHSMVTGILKQQSALIGDRVKKGTIIAEIDVPDLAMQVQRNTALVKQAEARVAQMEAKVAIAEADLEAAKAQVLYAEANARAATAWVSYRLKSFQRMKDLFATRSIEERLEDEAKERYEAAKESESAAKAAIVTARAQSLSSAAKIQLAKADVTEARAQVKIAEAELGKAQIMLDYARIAAPFDGIITQRDFYPGATIRAVGEKGSQTPLFTIQRTDMVRVVVQVPDNDARYADKDDDALIEFDAFRGIKFDAKVSRIAYAEDALTRLMRVEIDLPNPHGRIRKGMYGKVTLVLDKERDKLSIPRSCLAHGRSQVFVVRDGVAQLVKLITGLESTDRVMVLGGLDRGDRVVINPPSTLRHGIEVHASDLVD